MSMFASLSNYGSGAVPFGANVPTFAAQAGNAVSGIPSLGGLDGAPQFSLGSMGQPGYAPTPQFGFTPTGMPGAGDLGFNLPTAQLGLSGLAALGNLYGAFQANKLARDQLNFTKNITNTNLNNSMASYNTQLEDRARARAATEGQTPEQMQAYIDKNRLTR